MRSGLLLDVVVVATWRSLGGDGMRGGTGCWCSARALPGPASCSLLSARLTGHQVDIIPAYLSTSSVTRGGLLHATASPLSPLIHAAAPVPYSHVSCERGGMR